VSDCCSSHANGSTITDITRGRELRRYIAKAICRHEATLVSEIVEAIYPDLLA
jgi:hypothetical protein